MYHRHLVARDVPVTVGELVGPRRQTRLRKPLQTMQKMTNNQAKASKLPRRVDRRQEAKAKTVDKVARLARAVRAVRTKGVARVGARRHRLRAQSSKTPSTSWRTCCNGQPGWLGCAC